MAWQRLHILFTLAASVVALYAGTASAFFDAEAMVGKRWYSWKDDGVSYGVAAQEIALAAHVDPIPLVPVSFGLRLGIGSLNKNDLSPPKVDTAQVIEPGFDVMAWLPMVPVVTPYLRATVPIQAQRVIKGKADDGTTFATKETISGYQLGLGLKYSPIPLLSLLVEMQRGEEHYKVDEHKVGGVAMQSGDKTNVRSDAFLLGIEVGI